MTRGFGVSFTRSAMELAAGETALPRVMGAIANVAAITTGNLALTFFQAGRSETITQVSMTTGGTAAAATPTLCRIGIFSVDGIPSTGSTLTPVASIANDTTLFAAQNTVYTRTLTSSWAKESGSWYAAGVLVVSGAAMPTYMGVSGYNNYPQSTPLVNGTKAMADLPGAPFAASGVVANSRIYQFTFLP